MHLLDVLIVGAGPAGLAAAIAARQAGLSHAVIEKGVLVNSIYRFPPHMVFFTTPELIEIGGLPLVSPFEKPTRAEALRYYRRVVDHYQLDIADGVEVLSVQPEAGHAAAPMFRVGMRTKYGETRTRLARFVVMAIGYYDHPNRLGIPGEERPHVSHYYIDPHPFYRKQVVVVGGGNSAAEAALDLHRAGARVTLVHRHAALKSTIKYWVKPDIENRIKEGAVAALFGASLAEIGEQTVVVERRWSRRELPADQVFLLTGYHPDFDLLRRAGVEVDASSGVARYDSTTFETNIPGLFVAGGVVSGRNTAPIFIENGRFHGEAIVKVVADRLGRASHDGARTGTQ